MATRLKEPERSRVLEQVKAEYEGGMSIRAIAEHAELSYGVTRQLLLSAGVELRRRNFSRVPGYSSTGADPYAVPCGHCGVKAEVRCCGPYGKPRRSPHVMRWAAAAAA